MWQDKELDYWTRLVRTLEGAMPDGLFIPDVLGVHSIFNGDAHAACGRKPRCRSTARR